MGQFRVPGGVAELVAKIGAPAHVNKHEADGLIKITGMSESDLIRHESADVLSSVMSRSSSFTRRVTRRSHASSCANDSSRATRGSSTAAVASIYPEATQASFAPA